MNEPCLSVVIPVYNVKEYLGDCVRSVQNQTLTDLEIILVDDGSTDGSGDLCDALARQDSRIRVIHQKNAGPGMARNAGIEAAKAPYIAFMDSDDTLHHRAYEKAMTALQRNHADQARFFYRQFSGEAPDGPVERMGEMSLYSGRESMRRLAKVLFSQPYPSDEASHIGGSASMAVYSMDVIRRNGLRFNSERNLPSEDFLFNYEFYMASESVVWLPRDYYNYRMVPDSLTHRHCADTMHRVELYCDYVADMLRKDGFRADDRLYADGYCVNLLRVEMKTVFGLTDVPLGAKKEWFNRYVRGGYYRRHCRRYPTGNKTLRQRLLMFAMRFGWFYPCYAMTRGLALFRRR